MVTCRKTKFYEIRLLDSDFSSWLKLMAEEMYSTYCTVCGTSIALSNMGKHALRSHMAEKKPVAAVSCREQLANLNYLSEYCHQAGFTSFCICWCMHAVMQNHSLRGSESSVLLFPLMFPDSQIILKMKMHGTKIGFIFMVNFLKCAVSVSTLLQGSKNH
ncbi:hypothetical protein PR048_023519 [Dryococelus australis]|uniref:BED-type domain-containing protein n=1 Tax=Dryococelus australis TaxID=614101 RepID=A0ABQ9GUB2_9NEOP|nr:hypothetical protein PR048_023519 [Dryococelus australis]